MDLQRKIDVAKRAVESISRHDDEDSAARFAMLSHLCSFISDEMNGISARNSARIEALLKPAEPAPPEAPPAKGAAKGKPQAPKE